MPKDGSTNDTTPVINGGGAEKGEIIQCPECGVELEVVNEDPLELALAPEEEEDWGE